MARKSHTAGLWRHRHPALDVDWRRAFKDQGINPDAVLDELVAFFFRLPEVEQESISAAIDDGDYEPLMQGLGISREDTSVLRHDRHELR